MDLRFWFSLILIILGIMPLIVCGVKLLQIKVQMLTFFYMLLLVVFIVICFSNSIPLMILFDIIIWIISFFAVFFTGGI